MRKAPQDLLHTEQETSNVNLKISKKVVGALATTVAVGSVVGLSSTEQADHVFEEVGFAPMPPVSSAGAEALISLNDLMLNHGSAVLYGGLAATAIYTAARRLKPNSKLADMHDFTHQTPRKSKFMITGAALGIIGGASGLGDTAGKGASEPVQAMAEMVGADYSSTPIITGYDNTPYNYSGIDYSAAKVIIEQEGGTAVPFIQALGETKDPESKSNPSSSPIFAVPNSVLEASLGVSMPESVDCGDMSVIVGEQLGKKPGDTVVVNDMPATVAGTVDMKPGLDRVATIGSLEQMSECLFPDMPMTGAVALGLEGKEKELQATFKEALQHSYSARTFEEFEEEYRDFWDRSVKPPEMLLILTTMGLGGAAIGLMQTNEIYNSRRHIAELVSGGVKKKTIKRAYTYSTLRDATVTYPLGIATTAGFSALNNSSQFGLSEMVTSSTVGAGYAAVLFTSVLSTIANNHYIDKKIDTAALLRG